VDHFGTDQHQYNRSTAYEVTGVLISENIELPGHCYVVVHSCEGCPDMLSYYSPHCDYSVMYCHHQLSSPSTIEAGDKELGLD
jgi:hypothetical protein